MSNVGIAIMLTALAGLSTGIGGLAIFCSKKENKKFLAFTLGFSAGVMLYVSFMELMVKAIGMLSPYYGDKIGTFYSVVWFFGGVIMTALIARFIPEDTGLINEKQNSKNGLMRTGIVTALAMGIHNFPEGMATFVSALSSPVMAIPIVVAIAIHNIPEGMAVSVPVYFATGSRAKGFWYSFLSGIAEPIGAIAGYLILMPFFSEKVNAFVFAAVAGVMVFISVNELLPSAQQYTKSSLSVYGAVLGMAVMALSLILFM